MPNDSSKLKNVQPFTQAGDSLAPGVVEVDGSAGGQIDGGPVPSTAEEGVERRACDCETAWVTVEGGRQYFGFICYSRNASENVYCRAAKWDFS